MKNLSIRTVSDTACNTARANGKVIPFELIPDESASMLTMLRDGRSRSALRRPSRGDDS